MPGLGEGRRSIPTTERNKGGDCRKPGGRSRYFKGEDSENSRGFGDDSRKRRRDGSEGHRDGSAVEMEMEYLLQNPRPPSCHPRTWILPR